MIQFHVDVRLVDQTEKEQVYEVRADDQVLGLVRHSDQPFSVPVPGMQAYYAVETEGQSLPHMTFSGAVTALLTQRLPRHAPGRKKG